MMVILQRFWVKITSDRKRFGLLCAVLAAGLLLWARLIIVSKVPRTAVADGEPALAAANSPAQEPPSSDYSDKHLRKPVQIAVPANADRDPFLINREFFPKPHPALPTTQEASKSHAEPVENPEQEKARRHALILAHVERLRLDAAMTGAGMAVINGTLYQLNDMIRTTDNLSITFTLTEVRSRSVLLTCEDFAFELSMLAQGQDSPSHF